MSSAFPQPAETPTYATPTFLRTIHRDLKPDNVMLGNDGRVTITDFGIARAWQPSDSPAPATNEFVGTPEYMSPEQAEGGSLDLSTDIYSLGVMLFELLTGSVPFTGATPLITAAARLIKPPPDPRSRRPELPEAVAQVVLRCMSRKPKDRYANAEQVALAFTAALQGNIGLFSWGQAAASAPHGITVQIPPLPTAGDTNDSRSPTTAQNITLDAPPAGKTIAVLPFRNQGPAEDAYLADGLSDDLIDSLSMISGLRVCSRAAVAAHKNQPDPLAHGRALGVTVLVEGTIRRVGQQLRITARLVQVDDGVQVWAQRFDRPAADALQVSDEVAQAVTTALTGDVPQHQQRTVLQDAQAVDLYLRARAILQSGDPQSLRTSAPLLEQALALRPSDPMLLTAYARVKARLWFFGEGSGEVARQAAEQAVAAAPELGDSHLALATLRFHVADAAGAVQELKLAIKLAPNLAAAHDLLGRILVESGPAELGLRYIDQAVALEPWMAKIQVDRARVQALLGNWEVADQLVAELWRASQPTVAMWVMRARLSVWRRDRERNEAYLRSPELALPQFSLPREIFEVALGRRRAEPRKMFGTGVGSTGSSLRARAFFHQMEVELFSLQGDTDTALRSLARSVDVGLYDRLWLDGCPLLIPLRADLRFHALRRIVIARSAAVRDALR